MHQLKVSLMMHGECTGTMFFPRLVQRVKRFKINMYMLSTFCLPKLRLLFNGDLQHTSGIAGSVANGNRNGDEYI